ncbi:hypothetical protein [Polluticaenibacter yanchengensis]|uniref:Uncharacterized protein n=1 Tax=Polluticaenibacter yanchengensis TaxID=3014562 RepID=A0ABT4ULX2_9BACT|nr:hypothetical protein [Chitinophagaceae bacterium LY-5]
MKFKYIGVDKNTPLAKYLNANAKKFIDKARWHPAILNDKTVCYKTKLIITICRG